MISRQEVKIETLVQGTANHFLGCQPIQDSENPPNDPDHIHKSQLFQNCRPRPLPFSLLVANVVLIFRRVMHAPNK